MILVSVAIPVNNRVSRSLDYTIGSVLARIDQEFELIGVHDASLTTSAGCFGGFRRPATFDGPKTAISGRTLSNDSFTTAQTQRQVFEIPEAGCRLE